MKQEQGRVGEPFVTCSVCEYLGYHDFDGVCKHPRGLSGTVKPWDHCSRGRLDRQQAVWRLEKDIELEGAGFEL